LDSRSKIVTADAAPPGCTVVTGYFDVMLAAHVRELATLPRPLLAVILPLERELLPQRARAELAAGLRIIDYVVIAEDPDADALCERLRAAQIVRLEASHAHLTRQLIEHVHKRQTR
jgi:hypothetical protein